MVLKMFINNKHTMLDRPQSYTEKVSQNIFHNYSQINGKKLNF